MLFLIWIIAFVLAVILYYRKVYTRFCKYGVKNLTPIPILGDTARMTFRLEHFLESIDRIYKTFPEEKFVGSYEFIRPVVFIRDIELAKQITAKDFEHFIDHSLVVDDNIDPFFAKNLFVLKGQKWKDMRATLSPAFTSSKIRVMIPFMTEAGGYMISRIKRSIRESGRNYYDVEFKDLSTRFSNDVIASCAFGLKDDSQNHGDTQFYKMGKEISQTPAMKLFGFISFPKLMKMLNVTLFTKSTRNFFRQLVMQTMRDREENNIHRPDMIHLLMEAKKGNLLHEEDKTSTVDAGLATAEESNVGKSEIRVWSDDDLTAQAVLFLIAGFESASQVMTFVVHELAFHPDVQEKLAQEIREYNRKNGGKFDFTSIQELIYLDMVVCEVLRLWTPGGTLDRVCTKDYNLGRPNDKASVDYIIRKGESVRVSIWSFHRDPQYFPNPTKFDPERFSKENQHNIPPSIYNPFGIGPRNCIASRFALCMVKVMIYQLLQHVEVSPCEKTCRPIKLCSSKFNLIMKGGHWIRLKIRE